MARKDPKAGGKQRPNFIKMTLAREVERQMKEELERCVWVDQIYLKGEEELARRRELLGLREAAIKR
jgi:hypothetical protein